MENPFSVLNQKLDSLSDVVGKLVGARINGDGLDKDEFMRIEDAADFMQLKISTVRGYVRDKKITYYKQGGTLYFSKSDINDFIRKGVVEARSKSANRRR